MARNESMIQGRWRIVETELWDQEALDTVVPAYIRFDPQGMGEMQMIAIGASIDYRVEQRDGASTVKLTWAGFDEGDATSGRAWARIEGDAMRGEALHPSGRRVELRGNARARRAACIGVDRATTAGWSRGTRSPWSTTAAACATASR